MAKDITHEECLKILANPSPQIVLEALGYEYSTRGHADFRRDRPDIITPLVRAIVAELGERPFFPRGNEGRKANLFIHKRGDLFVFGDYTEPHHEVEHAFSTAEDAARCYICNILDSYWGKTDIEVPLRRRPPHFPNR